MKNAQKYLANFNFYMKCIFFETCFTLNLRENQNHKSKWEKPSKKWAFSKVLFGRSTKRMKLKMNEIDEIRLQFIFNVANFDHEESKFAFFSGPFNL